MEPISIGKIDTPYGTASVEVSKYQANNTLAVVLTDVSDGEAIMTLSTNLVDQAIELAEGEFFVKDYSENKPLIPVIFASELFEVVEGKRGVAGWVDIPVWKLTVKARLEYLRGQIRGECISWGGIAELQSLAADIEPGDTELLEWTGKLDELESCECDNGHEQNNTVCRWCWEKGRRQWNDPEVASS